ncbi:hypothetical protein [Microbacterium sp.]|uniref:hypothetical protein n=1 Tax=Microbacterium sp. TaxID=51671 RepID=UPI002BF540F2|nr:hypothetical protein [Microbacterium sp.]HWL78040.1 hypothetical protein [Microbacterium sp.]
MTNDIHIAFSEAVADTFDALRKSPLLNDPAVVKELDTSYVFLSEVTRVDPQVLFNNISKGAYDVSHASDHIILVSGKHPRELACDTCGKLLSHHGPAASYKTLLTAVQDIEAIAALHAAAPKGA